MARSEAFGRLLKAAIGSIVAHEGTTAPVIEDELGAQIGVSAASIQRYKAGHLPPEPRAVALLASMAVKRGFLNRAWLIAFLEAARYPTPAALIEQLCPASTRPAAPAGPVRDNLPAPTYAHFVPRPEPFADVLDGLGQRAAVVLIVGLGGVGKTSLAREVAWLCRAEALDMPGFAAVVWLSDRDHPGTTTLAALLHEIAITLDYPGLLQRDQSTRQREIEQLLRRQRVLLVVDNAETIADAQLLRWLTRLPEPSKALVTSRSFPEELRRSCWPVELGGLAGAEARALLAHMLWARKLAGRVHDAKQLDMLLAATGGNPKALELALGFLKGGAQTIQRVLDDLRMARGDLFDDLFDRSWSLLDGAARQILLALTLFAGAASRTALQHSAAVPEAAYGSALERLITLALVDATAGDLAAPRYALHPLVRAFASAKLHDQPAFVQAAQSRQLAWYADLAASVGYCWDDPARLNVLDGERETITALIRSAAPSDPQLARLVRGVDYYYYLRGLWGADAGISAARALLAQQSGGKEATQALAYHIQMLCRQGQLREAEQQLPQLSALAERAGLPDTLRFEIEYTRALYAMACGDDTEAIARWDMLLPLAQRVSVRAYAVNRGWLAICHYRQGARSEAHALWTAALRDSAAGGFVRGVVSAQIGLARFELDDGNADAAQVLLAAARHAAAGYGDRAAIAEIDALSARYHMLRGDAAAARVCLAASEQTIQRIGMSPALTATWRGGLVQL